MYSLASLSTESSPLLQKFMNDLMTVTRGAFEPEAPTVLERLESASVVFTTVCFGIFPAISLILAAITLLGMPILCRQKYWDLLRAAFGLSNLPASSSPNDLEAHLTAVRDRLPHSLVFLLVAGLVPFAGLVVGLAYYHSSPLPSLRAMIDPKELGPVRWILPCAAVALVAIQPIPVIGPVSLPLLYVTFHGVYDSILLRRLDTPKPVPMVV